MTRKDFQAIADALASSYTDCEEESVKLVTMRLARILADSNPRFDYHRFLAAAEYHRADRTNFPGGITSLGEDE